MAFSYTTDDLVSSVKVRGRIPTSQTTFTAAKILKLADEETEIGILPAVLKIRESFYLHETNITLAAATTNYRIPDRSIGGKLKSVCIVDTAGNETQLTKVEYEDRVHFGQTNPPVYYLKNQSIVLVGSGWSSADTLRVAHFIKPSTLVPVASTAKVSAINTTTKTVTVSSIPSTFTVSTPIDFVRGSGGFECLAIDVTPTALASTVFTFATLPADLEVGDYVCLAGETCIPQLPSELFTVLALRVTVTVLGSLGFINEMKAVQKKLDDAEEAVSHLISPRVDGSAKKIINRRSLLNSRRNY